MQLNDAAAEDFPTILGLARSALNLLVQFRVPPTPARFTVAYIHQSGTMTDLSLALNRLVGHDNVTPQAVDEIYDQFFGRFVEEAELRDASQRIERTVSDVIQCIDAASGSADRYGSVLAEFVDEAGNHEDDAMREAVSAILDETREMATANRQMEQRLEFSAREIQLLRQHLERLEREASLDSLTGIANRKSFDAALRAAIVRANADKQPLTVLMIDIDHFKTFNDTHGHLMGDQVLKLVAGYVAKCTKGQDTAARYGGEEFVVVLPQTGLTDGLKVAENIRRYVAAKKVVNRRTGSSLGQITLSIGAAEYRPGETAATLVHRADEALYLAKNTGRNRTVAETALPGEGA